MKDKPKFIDAKRRGFLQGSAVVGTAAAAGTTSADVLPEQPVETLDTRTKKHAGYRLTDRVREYYAKARF